MTLFALFARLHQPIVQGSWTIGSLLSCWRLTAPLLNSEFYNINRETGCCFRIHTVSICFLPVNKKSILTPHMAMTKFCRVMKIGTLQFTVINLRLFVSPQIQRISTRCSKKTLWYSKYWRRMGMFEREITAFVHENRPCNEMLNYGCLIMYIHCL